jgi:formate C-acetyltransferase
VLDDKIYRRGLVDFQADIDRGIAALDLERDPDAWDKREALRAMRIACDAVIRFSERHAALAEQKTAGESRPERRRELQAIAAICRHVPAHAPRTFWEALQAYWFCHLAVITELNGWDAFNPGHLDQHLCSYERGLQTARSPRARPRAHRVFLREVQQCPAPPKVGVTAAESGTYTDFANINLAGLLRDGSDGSNPVTHLLLEVIDRLHLLQPSSNLQLSRKTPDAVLRHALEVVRKGYGFPSIFNADVASKNSPPGQADRGREGRRVLGLGVEVGASARKLHPHRILHLPKVLEAGSARRTRPAPAGSSACTGGRAASAVPKSRSPPSGCS